MLLLTGINGNTLYETQEQRVQQERWLKEHIGIDCHVLPPNVMVYEVSKPVKIRATAKTKPPQRSRSQGSKRKARCSRGVRRVRCARTLRARRDRHR